MTATTRRRLRRTGVVAWVLVALLAAAVSVHFGMRALDLASESAVPAPAAATATP